MCLRYKSLLLRVFASLSLALCIYLVDTVIGGSAVVSAQHCLTSDGYPCTPTPGGPTLEPTNEPIYKTPTPKPTIDNRCPATTPFAFGTTTPNPQWLQECRHCFSTPTSTAVWPTARPSATITPGGPTLTPSYCIAYEEGQAVGPNACTPTPISPTSTPIPQQPTPTFNPYQTIYTYVSFPQTGSGSYWSESDVSAANICTGMSNPEIVGYRVDYDYNDGSQVGDFWTKYNNGATDIWHPLSDTYAWLHYMNSEFMNFPEQAKTDFVYWQRVLRPGSQDLMFGLQQLYVSMAWRGTGGSISFVQGKAVCKGTLTLPTPTPGPQATSTPIAYC